MTAREAKRFATALIARYARGRAEDGQRDFAAGFHLFSPNAVTKADTDRVCHALVELADELDRRVSGERKPTTPPIDPAQLSWLDLEAAS